MPPLRLLLVATFAVAAAPAAPPASYLQRWRDPALNERIDRNIERHRKGDATIELVDRAGKPLGGARVKLRQKGHEFLFGANAFVLGQLGERNRAYEDYAVFNLPIYITEITVPAAGEDGAALQAEVLRDFYRLWFSVSKMAGITYWNFADGTAVEGENEAVSGLVDDQMRPKPAYQALHRLIHEEWTTRAQAQTNERGTARFRGFFGPYEAVVTHDGTTKTFTFKHASRGGTHHRLVW